MGRIGSGGARRNAGRKPIDGETRSKISLTIPMRQPEMVRDKAARLPVSNLITDIITKGLER